MINSNLYFRKGNGSEGRWGEGTVVAAGGSMGLPKGVEISMKSGFCQESIDCVPCVTERQASTLLRFRGVLLQIWITERNAVGLARGFIRTGMDTVGAGKTTRDRSNMGRGGDGGHNNETSPNPSKGGEEAGDTIALLKNNIYILSPAKKQYFYFAGDTIAG